jgi:cytochrome c556
VTHTRRLGVIGLVLLPLWGAAGCTERGDEEVVAGVEGAGGAAAARSPDTAAPAAGQQTLLTVMAGLREDMVRLNDGLWAGDFPAVADAAQSVADHPQVGPGERTRVQAALGESFPAFAGADHEVHELALRVREAALRADTAAVLSTLADLQVGCVACHTRFRERLRR